MIADGTVWARARAIADAVLYEGYLLYPYRATSNKNRARWQFGVLGVPGAAESGLGEDSSLSAQFVVAGTRRLDLLVRFLQLQHRRAERSGGAHGYLTVPQLDTPSGSWLTWDEAVEVELPYGPVDLDDSSVSFPVDASAQIDVEELDGGRLVRERSHVQGTVRIRADTDGNLTRVTVTVRNTGTPAVDRDDAIARSMIGTHVIAHCGSGQFISLLEPPEHAAAATGGCTQHRCFPVLAGPAGTDDLLLVSPIILYDHPEIAEQSAGALFDSTEIDEILTLRVMTMTEDEKAQARATDPMAARIIDRCENLSPEAMLDLHGVLRDPHGAEAGLLPEVPDGSNWWDPLVDSAVAPESDGVLVDGVRVARGSLVRLRPSRRADAQDMFVAGLTAQVTSVHEDAEGNKYIGVVVGDDPAADLAQSYGRALYFSPEEIEPLDRNAKQERSPTWT